MSVRRLLHDGWSVRGGGHDVPARVPGCVHLDLLAAGRIPDPYEGDNETGLGWIGRTGWEYTTSFDWDDDGSHFVDLECDGLDTVATVTLNGAEVGRTQNMHRRYRFGVRHLLRPGSNELSVRFEPVYDYTERMRQLLGARPAAYGEPFNLVRKMACNFGWDWGPTLVTAGIWRPIGLRSWSIARLLDVRPTATASGRVEAVVTLDNPGTTGLTLTASVAGSHGEVSVAPGQSQATIELQADQPDLWWPRGFGAQTRYPLMVSLLDSNGGELDRWEESVGFRDVAIDSTPDGDGTPYTVVVNGVPVFVRGVNWIPDDCFPSRITRSRLEQRLRQACDANVNFLRVWGGGLYESEEFYDVADELGLLVGQDFLFSCAAYPEEEPIASEVEAEARDNIARLARHPSLALWTGNNECLWGHEDWGWQSELGDRTWGAGYYLGILPLLMAELDPARPYWPGSPYSGSGRHPNHYHPNNPDHGSCHIWDVWNELDYTHYRTYTPRFVAEFGFQGPPSFATLGRGEHQKAEDGARKLQRALDRHFPPPKDRDDWHFYTQLNQARAISLGVRHFRSQMPRCMGAIVWQLNDCWPVTSWSAIDGEGHLKPMWYALRAAFADRLLSIEPADPAARPGTPLRLVAVNDSPQAWRAMATVSRLGLDGRPLAKATVEIDVPRRSRETFDLPPELSTPDDPAAELTVASVEDHRSFWFFTEDREIAYPTASLTADVSTLDGEIRVTVHARTILRDLTLFPDRLDPAATVDQAMVTLLPGESATFTVRTALPLRPQDLTSRPVLRCVNDSN
ncbi:MAG TPA: hypothetical protein VF062_17505 [Candidatus Limnocylindrales bacterium]